MGNEIKASKYSSIRSKRVDWLWYPYIAYGKITLLQGDPGDGKSTFILNIVGLLTRGKGLPDGTKRKKPITVIYQCNEDNKADTIKPRLLRAGADCDRTIYLESDNEIAINDSGLENIIRDSGARLVIFDPIQSFLPQGTDMMNAARARSVMSSLARAAENCNCAVVLIGHMNKDSGGKSLYRVIGSIDIAAIARSILMISRDDEDPRIRRISQIKNNLGPEGMDIVFSIEEDGGITWIDNPESSNDKKSTTGVLGKAKSTIIELLTAEDIRASEVLETAKIQGISERTLRSAMKELGVEAYKSGKVWYWHLPNESTLQD